MSERLPVAPQSCISEHRLGGYLYARLGTAPIDERIIPNTQAKQEMNQYRRAVHSSICEPDRWKPYFNYLPDGPAKTALEGLRKAVPLFASAKQPIGAIHTFSDGRQRAFVGSLAARRELESWERRDERGVTRFSLMAFISQKERNFLVGQSSGKTEIFDADTRTTQEHPIDWFEYLPHIDESNNYTVRHKEHEIIALGDAVYPMLQENGFGRLWDRYIEPVK